MLKEGAVVDSTHRERIAKLLRFASSLSEDPEAKVSLDEIMAACPRTETHLLPGRPIWPR